MPDKPARANALSPDLAAPRVEKLRELVPEAFVEGRLDCDRLHEALGDAVDDAPERYSFTWAGKRDAIRLLQLPSRATLRPAPEQSLDWDTTRNLFIEGENLEALKLLLRPYYGRVKMIYIDPPYNTGNDFIYPDDYRDPLGAYLEQTGQVAGQGDEAHRNRITSGRRHSGWLSMMYPRLWLARQLLREDGVIFISIDDNEVHNLRMFMNEVFGEENFVATIIWHKIFSSKNTARHFSEDHDYVMVFARHGDIWGPNLLPRSEGADARYTNADDDPRGPWASSDLTARNYYSEGQYEVRSPSGKTFRPTVGTYWRVSKANFDELDRDGRVWWGAKGGNMPRLKRFLAEVKQGMVPRTIWHYDEVGHTQEAKQELLRLVRFTDTENVLDTVKPPRLLVRLLQLATVPDANDIVLDFFSGSSVAAQAVLELNREDGGNRRFIMVQLPEPLPRPEECLATIADIGKERIRRVIARMKEKSAGEQGTLDLPDRETPEDLGFRVFTLGPSNYRAWAGVDAQDTDDLADRYGAQMELHLDGLVDDWRPEDVIAEVALKEAGFGLDYGVEEVGERLWQVTDGDTGREFYMSLAEEVRLEEVEALGLREETLFVCRATALDDTTAGNLQLQCRLRVV